MVANASANASNAIAGIAVSYEAKTKKYVLTRPQAIAIAAQSAKLILCNLSIVARLMPGGNGNNRCALLQHSV